MIEHITHRAYELKSSCAINMLDFLKFCMYDFPMYEHYIFLSQLYNPRVLGIK